MIKPKDNIAVEVLIESIVTDLDSNKWMKSTLMDSSDPELSKLIKKIYFLHDTPPIIYTLANNTLLRKCYSMCYNNGFRKARVYIKDYTYNPSDSNQFIFAFPDENNLQWTILPSRKKY